MQSLPKKRQDDAGCKFRWLRGPDCAETCNSSYRQPLFRKLIRSESVATHPLSIMCQQAPHGVCKILLKHGSLKSGACPPVGPLTGMQFSSPYTNLGSETASLAPTADCPLPRWDFEKPTYSSEMRGREAEIISVVRLPVRLPHIHSMTTRARAFIRKRSSGICSGHAPARSLPRSCALQRPCSRT